VKTFPWKEFLRKHPLFSTVRDEKILDALLDDEVTKEHLVPKDEIILRQGEVGGSVFLIGAGSVEAVLQVPDSPPVLLSELRRGEIFGEMAFIERRPRSATIRTKEPTTVLEILGAPFQDLIDDYPDIEFRLLLKITERLRNANEQILSLQLKGVDEKIRFLNAKLDSEHKVVDAALRASQTVFDQTKLRADEVIFSAERARDRLNRAVAVIAVVGPLILGVLGGFGLKELWNVQSIRQQAQKHADDAKTAGEQAMAANNALDRARDQVARYVFLPGFGKAIENGSWSEAGLFYDEAKKLGRPEVLLEALRQIEENVVAQAKPDNQVQEVKELTRVMQGLVNDAKAASMQEHAVKAYYLLASYAILTDRRDLHASVVKELQQYLNQNKDARIDAKAISATVTGRFERESEGKSRAFTDLRNLIVRR
jgi:CRP-like cAMP-binding protein